jgi:hypothetical protein
MREVRYGSSITDISSSFLSVLISTGKDKPPGICLGVYLWCGREDLNLHELPHYHLKVARLPIPPRPHAK